MSLAKSFILDEIRRTAADNGGKPLGWRRFEARTDACFPDAKTFERLGSKRERLAKLVRFCERSEALADVVALCAIPASNEPAEAATPEAAVGIPAFGSVYLIKSGRFFKMGAPTQWGVASDDPSGIEGYWHARFAERRRNGEWFESSAADVAAFERRRFM